MSDDKVRILYTRGDTRVAWNGNIVIYERNTADHGWEWVTDESVGDSLRAALAEIALERLLRGADKDDDNAEDSETDEQQSARLHQERADHAEAAADYYHDLAIDDKLTGDDR